jgi:antibiotic biosynthesis monooxygenase (ABM) superfamily enzyme
VALRGFLRRRLFWTANMTAMECSADQTGKATIVVQTRVRQETEAAFAAWQVETGRIVAEFPGFVEQTVMQPSPPAQVDWVILQRFVSKEAAVAWLNSEQRQKRLEGIAPMLAGRDDVHIVTDGDTGVLPGPVSAVMSTRVKPGKESAHRAWARRIAAAQSKAPGFQGHRIEAPIPNVQDHWLSIVRFDTEANLRAWLASPERQKLLPEASDFTEEFRARIVRTGFDQWFPAKAGGTPPGAWKQNMLVLLLLYPVVFLFFTFVQAPLLTGRAGLPFAVALFIANAVSVLLLNYLVPWTCRWFSWWLASDGPNTGWLQVAGATLVIALYGLMLFAFGWLL